MTRPYSKNYKRSTKLFRSVVLSLMCSVNMYFSTGFLNLSAPIKHNVIIRRLLPTNIPPRANNKDSKMAKKVPLLTIY